MKKEINLLAIVFSTFLILFLDMPYARAEMTLGTNANIKYNEANVVISKTMNSDENLILIYHEATNNNCHSLRKFDLILIEKPQNGKIKKKVVDYKSERKGCVGAEIKALRVNYIPKKGFKGNEKIIYNMRAKNLSFVTVTASIKVQ